MATEDMMTLTKRERAELERPVGTRTGRADAARRARLLLLLADGHTWAEIRGKLDCHDSFIARWSQRFTGERQRVPYGPSPTDSRSGAVDPYLGWRPGMVRRPRHLRTALQCC